LILPDGSREPVHRHDWVVTAAVSSDRLDNMGVVMDFQILKATVDKATAEFDNRALDEIDHFRQNNPSAENVAKYIYGKLRVELPEGVELRSIQVVEEPGCSAKFAE